MKCACSMRLPNHRVIRGYPALRRLLRSCVDKVTDIFVAKRHRRALVPRIGNSALFSLYRQLNGQFQRTEEPLKLFECMSLLHELVYRSEIWMRTERTWFDMRDASTQFTPEIMNK